MTLIDFVFPKLWSLKTWLDICLKSPFSEDPSKSNMVNWSKHCWNLNRSTFIILIDNFQGIWVEKGFSYWHAKSWDCLATDDKFPVLNRDNLTIPSQMQLSQKQKHFSQYFSPFLKSRWDFQYLEKKDDPHRFCISENTDCENVPRYV